jgi:hypothetical protein
MKRCITPEDTRTEKNRHASPWRSGAVAIFNNTLKRKEP